MKYTKQVLICKIFNNRTFSLLIYYTLIIYIYLKPFIRFSQTVQYKSTPWIFPFMISNIYFMLLFMLGVIYYFSDVPFMQQFNMYQLIRTGRRKWAVGQIGSIIVQSFAIMVINNLIVFIVLGRNANYKFEWGKILHTISMTNVGNDYNLLFEVNKVALSYYEPLELLTISIFIGGLVISFVGLSMFCISLIWRRLVAVIVNVGMVIVVFFVQNVHVMLTESFGRFVPINWIRVANIGSKKYGYYLLPSFQFIVITLIFLIALMSIFILLRIKNIEFSWNMED